MTPLDVLIAPSQPEYPRRFQAEMPQITGSCVCGQLRYTAQAEPIFSAVCHCKTCQKQTGTAFRVVIAVPLAAVSIQGSPTFNYPHLVEGAERAHKLLRHGNRP